MPFGGLSWALDGADAPAAAVLRLREAMAARGALTPRLEAGGGPAGARDPLLGRALRLSRPARRTRARRVDLILPAGSSLAIVGRNGAGKTTLSIHPALALLALCARCRRWRRPRGGPRWNARSTSGARRRSACRATCSTPPPPPPPARTSASPASAGASCAIAAPRGNAGTGPSPPPAGRAPAGTPSAGACSRPATSAPSSSSRPGCGPRPATSCCCSPPAGARRADRVPRHRDRARPVRALRERRPRRRERSRPRAHHFARLAPVQHLAHGRRHRGPRRRPRGGGRQPRRACGEGGHYAELYSIQASAYR